MRNVNSEYDNIINHFGITNNLSVTVSRMDFLFMRGIPSNEYTKR